MISGSSHSLTLWTLPSQLLHHVPNFGFATFFLESNLTDTVRKLSLCKHFPFCFVFSLVDNDNTPSSRRQVRACGLLFVLSRQSERNGLASHVLG